MAIQRKSVVKMAAALTADQEVATKAFIDAVSESGAARVSRATAVKFLLARKFDVARAHALWRQHEATRRREGLARFDPLAEPLKSELATGKFTVLQTRDATGAAIAVFTANKHIPSESSHQTTLQGLVYQLDVALQSLETQRAGLVFIYDMTDSKYTNFDYDLSQKILTLLKGGYPAKLKKVLIVTAPLWFKAPFRILRLFVREKLRERVHTVSTPQLGVHVPRAALPPQLGGTQPLDHHAWLLHCLKSFTNSGALVCGAGAGAPGEYASGAPGGGGDMAGARLDERRHAAAVNHKIARDDPDDDDLDISTSGRTTSLWCSDAEQGGSASSGFSDEEGGGAWGAAGGLPPAQFLAAARALGRRGLAREYDEIRARPPAGTFINAKLTNNLAKNRYTDVLCYDHSRVLLSQTDPDDPCSDYVNANYVDGYKQKNAFISTQGPLPKTYSDFWRMVWEQHSLVIVMTTKAVERGRVKCGQYWPIASGQKATYGDFEVLTENVRANQDYVVSDLLVTNIQTEEVRPVSHWQYIRWPDYGVPGGGRAAPVLEFLAGVRAAQATARRRLGDAWAGHSRGPPIVVHCSAGIGRTGTFLTLDICISRLEDTGFIDVRSTVEKIRSQRAYSIQMPDQYIFCHLALIEYAVASGYLDTADWSGFDDDNDEDDDE